MARGFGLTRVVDSPAAATDYLDRDVAVLCFRIENYRVLSRNPAWVEKYHESINPLWGELRGVLDNDDSIHLNSDVSIALFSGKLGLERAMETTTAIQQHFKDDTLAQYSIWPLQDCRGA